jgi:hypothetical protein
LSSLPCKRELNLSTPAWPREPLVTSSNHVLSWISLRRSVRPLSGRRFIFSSGFRLGVTDLLPVILKHAMSTAPGGKQRRRQCGQDCSPNLLSVCVSFHPRFRRSHSRCLSLQKASRFSCNLPVSRCLRAIYRIACNKDSTRGSCNLADANVHGNQCRKELEEAPR